MIQSMRWFGPSDGVSLSSIRQAGATEVVSALHDLPNGSIWPSEAIQRRKAEIQAAGLEWTVVESLPVHEGIKTADPNRDALLANYAASLRNLADAGITVVAYNFMPLLDWTRTDLAWELADGVRALRFEWDAVAAYDLHILERPNVENDYDDETKARAERRFNAMDKAARSELERTILAGLPGAEEHFTSERFRNALRAYHAVDADTLRANHHTFVAAVAPVAEECGIQLVVHPDDPPFPLFGLPRVVSTTDDLELLFAAVPSRANGLCFCTGSFGVRADNDLPGMVRRFCDRIGFFHLRSVQREGGRDFHEAAHLEGSAEMVDVLREIVAISRKAGRRIPMRPDHGHQMLDDLAKTSAPGYSLLGRMRGLAELRGVEAGLMSLSPQALPA